MEHGRELDWDDLRYLLHVADERSFSGAARAMGVRHSTVGRRITALEQTLGAALILRRADGPQLTRLGEEIVKRLGDIDRAVAAIVALTDSQLATIRLAIPSGFSRLVSESVAELRRTHPAISLDIVGGAATANLQDGEADLAIRLGPITDDRLIARKVGDVGFALYAAHDYLARRAAPTDVSDLSGHEVVGFDARLAATPPGQWLAAHVGNATTVLRAREMTEVLSAATGGVGLAVLPCILADQHATLCRLSIKLVATRPLFLVFLREARVQNAVRAVAVVVSRILKRHANEVLGTA